MRSFWTQVAPLPQPVGDFSSKTVIVTGANRCLGLEAAKHFVRLGAEKVILGCRDVARGIEARREIEEETGRRHVVEVWPVDLASFSSVQTFCRRAAALERLDIVVENAALKTADYDRFEGYERQVTVNVISTWLMALMLLPVMKRTWRTFYQSETEDNVPHLTIVGSNALFYAPFRSRDEDLVLEEMRGDANMGFRYHDTKLVSALIARAVAESVQKSTCNQGEGGRLPVVLNMVDPGYCQSDLLRHRPYPFPVNDILNVLYWVLARTSEMGSRTYIAAVTAGVESHGQYLEDCQLSTLSAFVTSEEGQRVQKRMFVELSAILENIEPGIMNAVG